jgi:N-acetylmuramic acid 6-phosphate etherase
VKMGRVYRGLMVDMRARNAKLRRRAQRIVSEIAVCSESEAVRCLEKTGGELKAAILVALGLEASEATRLLERHGRNLRAAIASMRGNA